MASLYRAKDVEGLQVGRLGGSQGVGPRTWRGCWCVCGGSDGLPLWGQGCGGAAGGEAGGQSRRRAKDVEGLMVGRGGLDGF